MTKCGEVFSKMPSKEHLSLRPEGNSLPSTNHNDFISRDIDELVLEIKDNLKLKAKPSHIGNAKTKLRASPYSIPSRTESKCACCNSFRCTSRNSGGSAGSNPRHSSDDPYEIFQDLLKEGELIKEAVKRLQMGLAASRLRRSVYYDSDEEFRTPPFPFDDIEV